MERLTPITSAQELQQLCSEIGMAITSIEAEEGLGILRNSIAEAAAIAYVSMADGAVP